MNKKLMSSALTIAALTTTSVGSPQQARTPSKPGAQGQTCKKGGNDEIRRSVEKKVKQMVVDELGVDAAEVTPNARFINDLGADSLDIVELVMRFEEEFGIEIRDADAEKLQRVCDVYDYVEKSVRRSDKKVRRVKRS